MPLPCRLPFASPFRGTTLAFLCALYILPGLIGHDPWKGDDVTHFGVVYALLEGDDWLAPRLAGEPWLDSPPLYYWVAAALARLFAFLLPLHDGARLASGLALALMLAFLVGAARHLGSRDTAPAAALVAIGCLGLLIHGHEIQPATAFLAAAAASYYGLACLPQHPLRGGAITGAAIGLGFAADGLPAILGLVPPLLLLPFVSSRLRTAAARGMLVAMVVAIPIAAAWPLALAAREPALLNLWWAREAAELRLVPAWLTTLWGYLQLLSWLAWPALPLATWTLWKERRHLNEPRVLLPLASFVVLLGVQSTFFEPRSLNALPLLPPLILLAVPATTSLRRGAANAFDWFGMMTFTLVAGLIWLGWTAMVTGVPARIARNFAKLEPGFVAQFSWPAFIAAAALSLTWLWLIVSSPRRPMRATTHWAAGMTLTWVLLMALWLPVIEYSKTYRGVATALKAIWLAHSGCVAGRGLGESQRASLHYFAGLVTRPEGSRAAASCQLFLTQGTAWSEPLPPGASWRKIWEGHRPGDRVECFRLYVKD